PSPEPDGMEFFYTGAGGHHLHPLDHVRQLPDGRLNFFMEYQGDWDGLTLPEGEDPSVWIEGDWDDPADEECEDDQQEAGPPKSKKVCESLSKFLVTHCLMTTLYEGENSPCADSGSEGPLIEFFNRYNQ